MDQLLPFLVGLVLLALVAAALGRAVRSVTVYEYERGVRYRDGRFDGLAAPGRHWFVGPWTTIVRIDVRPRLISVPGQEVTSADGVGIKMSLAAEYRVADAAKALNEIDSFAQALYLTLQIALREAVGSRKVDEVLEARDEVGRDVLNASREEVSRFGLELRSVEVKDVMFPGDLKKIFASVVQAQKESQAALEKARGETAALRNLANAARLVEANPGLMQLRALQQLGESRGSTLILGMPPASTPVPVRTQQEGPAEPEQLPPSTPE